jgi:hypothetical protein
MPCPIPTSHGRLRELHHLWHQALAAYGDPDAFAFNLNAVVQAARNVTFLLQAEKERVQDFDAWYPAWQERLRADPVVAWAADAPTTIVHKSDLERTSTAIARIHDNLDVIRFKMKVPAEVPTDMLALGLLETAPDAARPLIANCILAVERTWIVEGLPDQEILDALAHVYGELAALLAEAHVRAGVEPDACRLQRQDEAEHVPSSLGDRPLCMRVTNEARTVRLSLADGRFLSAETITARLNPTIDAQVLEKRYGKPKNPFVMPSTGDPTDMAPKLVQFAKHILRTDGHHDRMFWLRDETGKWHFRVVFAQNRQEKYALMRRIAEDVERHRADAIVEIGEVWVVKTPKNKVLSDWPENIPNRREALLVSVSVLMSEGPRITRLTTPFYRDKKGRIRFRRTELESNVVPYYLDAVLEVWAKLRRK